MINTENDTVCQFIGSLAVQGVISVKEDTEVDRERDGVNVDSEGRGVLLLEIEALNEKPASDPGEDFATRETVGLCMSREQVHNYMGIRVMGRSVMKLEFHLKR